VESASAKLSSDPRNQHITTFNRAEMWPTSDVDDRQAYPLKVGWTSAADTVEGSDSHHNYIVSTDVLVTSEAHHEGLVRCARTCQHWRPDGRQRSAPSAADEWLVLTRRTELRYSSQLDWLWMLQPVYVGRQWEANMGQLQL